MHDRYNSGNGTNPIRKIKVTIPHTGEFEREEDPVAALLTNWKAWLILVAAFMAGFGLFTVLAPAGHTHKEIPQFKMSLTRLEDHEGIIKDEIGSVKETLKRLDRAQQRLDAKIDWQGQILYDLARQRGLRVADPPPEPEER